LFVNIHSVSPVFPNKTAESFFVAANHPDSKAEAQAVVQFIEPSMIRFEALCNIPFHIFELFGGKLLARAKIEKDVIICVA
jgi:hypothetical protein